MSRISAVPIIWRSSSRSSSDRGIKNQGVVGSTTVKFTIARDGTIQAPQVEKPSGFIALDNSAMRAVQITRLPPLPAAFQNPTLTVHMRFDYQR